MEFLKGDTDLRLLFLVLAVSIIFAGSTIFYNLRLNDIQADYDEKIAKLEEIEEQLIMQEERLKALSELKNSVSKDKETLEQNFDTMKNEYEVLRLEEINLKEKLDSKPFSKLHCRSTGNAECQN